MRLLPQGRKRWLRFGVVWSTAAIVAFIASSLMIRMPGSSYSGPLAPLSEEQAETRGRLERDVRVLAEEIGERNIWNPRQLEASADYIGRQLRESGCEPTSQTYTVRNVVVRNVEAEKSGLSRPDEILVVGAHYDSLAGTTGANDNASGVAGVLEIARLVRQTRLARAVRFVAFVNEEPPFFLERTMGSIVYARRCRQRGEKIVGMFSLETIGFYSDEKGSQDYPFPFRLFYPSTGNFIGFVGNCGSRGFVRQTIESFRRHARFPSEGAAIPSFIPGAGWSDHSSFWGQGYPALMVTDTAPFRYPFYHTVEDTPDKIDYGRMARVVCGLARVVEELAGAE